MKTGNLIKSSLLIVLLGVMTACGGGGDTTEAPPPQSAEIDGAEPDGGVDTDQQVVDPATAAESVESALEAVEESDAEEAEDLGDRIVLASAEPEAEKPARTDWKYSANQHYTALTSAQGTSSAPDKIEVAEVFWYGCSHCYNFDPIIQNWENDLPSDVSFVRLPVMWNPTNEIHARIFYAADALGKLEEMHDEIFKEIHINKKTLTSESEIEKFFARFGVSSDDFAGAFRRSPSVEKNITRARNLTTRYGIRSVPVLVVNGKYVTSGSGIKNFNDLLAVAGELVERERQDR
jgi:thiol:disulfide interchange protein DsbA